MFSHTGRNLDLTRAAVPISRVRKDKVGCSIISVRETPSESTRSGSGSTSRLAPVSQRIFSTAFVTWINWSISCWDIAAKNSRSISIIEMHMISVETSIVFTLLSGTFRTQETPSSCPKYVLKAASRSETRGEGSRIFSG